MATLRDVKRKIQAVKKTQKITKAMNMVAASKLKGAQEKMEAFWPYADKIAQVLARLIEHTAIEEEHVHPFLISRKVENVDLLLMTSDRGLCGSFNASLIAKAEGFIKEKSAKGITVCLTCIGRKGRDYFHHKKYNIRSSHVGIVGGRFGFNAAVTLGKGLIESFLNGETDEAYVIFSKFVSMTRYVPTLEQLLPMGRIEKFDKSHGDEEADYVAEYICEPSAKALMAEILPKCVYAQLFRALLETSTSEHAARAQAMDKATTNCADMINSLTLVFNKARQAAITKELMDIVGGAEALRGSW
ncbi:MAG: ATP synthase F1 subunit gamma [Deltaproteobacteria bacterium]|nr:MAG: ATP synthase F1 subunit gamma [Deltaproteobacteria bacterium]